MRKIELHLVKKLDYSQIIANLMEPYDYEKQFTRASYSAIMIVALTTGLPLRGLIGLKWNAILEYDDFGGVKCLDKFNLERGYDFIISNKIQKQFLIFYKHLNQPSFHTRITEGYWSNQTRKSWLTKVYRTLGLYETKKLIKDGRLEILNADLTQIVFGRRVLETCGYSNKTANFLKGLFDLKTSHELLTSLGYESRNDLNYKLSNISIIEGVNNKFKYGKPKSFLKENKHFLILKKGSQEYYPFQHFQVFYDFLNITRIGFFDVKERGVLVLLMISLTNGIRPSSLLKLIWSDLFVAEKKGTLDCYTLKDSITLGRHQITLDPNTKKKILLQFSWLHYYFDTEDDYDNYVLTILKKLSDSEIDNIHNLHKTPIQKEGPSLSDPCFVTSKMNAITQPSLNREIRTALLQAGFKHAHKFKTESTMIMYGRRILEIKGNHTPTIRALVKHFKKRSKKQLFEFLEIDYDTATGRPNLKEFNNVFEHILYDV